MTRGDKIAWVLKQYGCTNGLSALHRVFENDKTYCLRPIPPEKRWLDLTLVEKGLEACDLCEELCAKGATLAEAVRASRSRTAA